MKNKVVPDQVKSWASTHTPQPQNKTSLVKMEGFDEEKPEYKNPIPSLVLDANSDSESENCTDTIEDTDIKKSDIKKYLKFMYENSR